MRCLKGVDLDLAHRGIPVPGSPQQLQQASTGRVAETFEAAGARAPLRMAEVAEEQSGLVIVGPDGNVIVADRKHVNAPALVAYERVRGPAVALTFSPGTVLASGGVDRTARRCAAITFSTDQQVDYMYARPHQDLFFHSFFLGHILSTCRKNCLAKLLACCSSPEDPHACSMHSTPELPAPYLLFETLGVHPKESKSSRTYGVRLCLG